MKCDNIELLRENIHKKDLQLLHGIALGVCRKFGKAMEELEIDEQF